MLDDFKNSLSELLNLDLVYLTLGLIVSFQLIKLFIFKKIDSSKNSTEADKVLSKKRIRDYGRVFLLVALFSLWFSQLQALFVSLLAFLVAIVIAFKEVIMCITGGLIIQLNKAFSTGDRIEVNGIRGFVIEKNITATKVLEIGPEKNSQQTTGNTITIPNSIFLSSTATNQSYFQNYSIRSFTFSPANSLEFEKSEEVLLQIANDACHSYLKRARDSISKFCRKEGILIPSIDPRIKLVLSDNNESKLLLKMPVDNKKIGDIEQKLYREYYKFVLSVHEKVKSEDNQ